MELTVAEIRVLGCLMEKAATTPDHYPLTTNALVAACNQKTNRDPVVSFDERTVNEAMLELRQAGLARSITGSGRTVKHRHVADEALELGDRAAAVLAVLLLRGPQTPGELRTRTERYVGFDSVEAVDEVLVGLLQRDTPLVEDLGRGPGQSQNRWVHTLGSIASPTISAVPEPSASVDGGATRAQLLARVEQLEARMQRLEAELGMATEADEASVSADEDHAVSD